MNANTSARSILQPSCGNHLGIGYNAAAGIGTSAPEILVSANAALDGKSELALGNAIGSNIANIAFIIGVTALIIPIVVLKTPVWKTGQCWEAF